MTFVVERRDEGGDWTFAGASTSLSHAEHVARRIIVARVVTRDGVRIVYRADCGRIASVPEPPARLAVGLDPE